MFIPSGVAAAAVDATDLRTELVGASLTDGSGGAEEVAYRLLSTGEEQTSEEGAAFSTIGTWLVVGEPAQFQARFNATGDETTPDVIGVWHDLDVTVEFGLVDGVARNTVGTIEIREKVSQVESASASLELDLAGP